jgi:undecaprenyl pyrophosphate phosphatase UppP
MVHGIFLTVAWAVLTPIGIGVSLLRNALDSAGYAKGTWYKIHFYSNLLSVLFTIIGFGIAIALVEEEESEIHVEDVHQRLGRAILVIAVLQGVAAYFRPGLPKPKEIDEEDQEQASPKK